MADQKITQLPEYVNPQRADVFPIVDKTNSETKQIAIPATVYSPATFVIAPLTSNVMADYYTTGTNDDGVIQAAINGLPAGGGKILLQAGVYTFGNVVSNLVSNLIIQGQGEATILKLASGANSRMFYNPVTPLSNITFQDLQIDGNGVNQIDGASRDDRALLILFNITNFKLLNCLIHDCRSGAAVRISGCNRILYQGNTFVNNGMNGGSFQADHTFTGDSTSYRVIGNHFENCTDTGTAQDGVVDSTITGNKYVNCQSQAISISASPIRPSKQNVVANNVIDGIGSSLACGIHVSNFGNGGTIDTVTLSSNVIGSCDRAIYLDDCLRVVVGNNQLFNAQGANQQLLLLGGNTAIQDLTIEANIFCNTVNRGISFDVPGTVGNANISNNKFIATATPIGGTIPSDAKIHDNEGLQMNYGEHSSQVTSANNFTPPIDANSFQVTGSTPINDIDVTNFRPGDTITLLIQGTFTIKHNLGGSGNFKPIILKGDVDFNAVPLNTLTLIWDSIGNAWFEVARKETLNTIGATKTVAPLTANVQADYYTTGTNDHLIINTALAALPNGGTVLLVQGTYVLGGSIVMKNYQRLVGQGKGTIITPSAGSTYDLIKGQPSPTFNRYCDVENIKIDCSNQLSGHAINIYAPRNNSYKKIWFTAVKGSCINMAGDVTNLGWYNWITECEVDGIAGDGITSPAYCEHNYIINNTITFVSGYGVYMQSDSDLIQSNQFDHCGKVTIFVEFGAGVWRIMDNFIDRPQDHGIKLHSAPATIVSGNTFGTGVSGKALIANDSSDKLIVTDNMMTISGASYGINEIGAATDRCRYEGNNFVGGPATAINLNSSSTNLKVNNNQGYNSQSPSSSIASTNNLTLPGYNKYFPISGTTQINLLDVTNFEAGSVITLRFQGNITIKHNQTASGNFKSIILKNSVDFAAKDGSTLTLAYDGIGNAWFEVARRDSLITAGATKTVAPLAANIQADYYTTGTSDDVVINAAIQAVIAGGGGKILLREGTYTVTNHIILNAYDLWLDGMGTRTVIKQANGANVDTILSITGTNIAQIKVSNLHIEGNKTNNTFGNGITMQTPGASNSWVLLEDVVVFNCPNNGLAWNANSGSSSYYLARVHSSGNNGNGFFCQYNNGAALTDSVFESCIADTNALNGFYLATLDTHFTDCKAYFNGSTAGSNHGFYLAGYNNYFTNCEAQDNFQSGFYLNNDGDGTYGTQNNVFVNCDADSNNQALNGSYGVGFQIKNTSGTQLIGCQAYVRPYPFSWGQRIGVSLEGTTTNTSLIGLTGSGNSSTLYSDTSSGTNYHSNTAIGKDLSYSPATIVIAPKSSGYQADYYTTGTNDNAVIQTAINALPAGGGKIFLAAGTYFFGNVITTLVSNLTMQGVGEATVLKLANGANSRMFYNPTTALNTITFRDLQIDGNGGNQTDGVARDDRALLMLFNITNFALLNCFIHDCRSGAAVKISACNRILYQGNIFINNGMNGGAFQADHTFVGDSTNYRVIGNHFENCTDTGTAQDGVINATVVGNTYINCQSQAIRVSATSLRPSKQIVASDNVVDGTGSVLAMGIHVANFGNGGTIDTVTLSDNIIGSCDRAIYLDDCSRMVISDNQLFNAQGTNKQLLLLGGNSAIQDTTIEANVFCNTTSRGISFDVPGTVTNANIFNNKFIAVTTAIGGTIPNDTKIRDNQGYNSQSPANSIASANNLSLPGYNHYFPISGTTQINLVDITNFEGGSTITLRFQGAITIKHNQTASGNNKSLVLNGGGDFVAADGNTLTLAYDGVGNAWFETGRKT